MCVQGDLHAVQAILVCSLFLSLLAQPGCGNQGRSLSTAELPPHHTPAGFRNLHLETEARTGDFFRWKLGLGPDETPAFPPEQVPPYQPDPVEPDLARIRNPDPGTIQVTWVGHSTFLIQVDGVNILTDPLFSKRASPVSFAGPRRVVPPGIPFDELPEIHGAVISHNHYDHLDAKTVKGLAKGTTFLVPLRLAAWFEGRGIQKVVELDWWQSEVLGPLRITAVPAQHFSSRSFSDRNKTLWSGWVIESTAGAIYFSGCTGYAPQLFREIGQRLGPMRISFIPIGAYRPRWFMKPMHVDPPEAVQVHHDVRSQQSIAMHWGTFDLTDEPMAEPPLFLRKALEESQTPQAAFLVMRIGETRTFAPRPAAAERGRTD